ncbi:MAG: phosphoribosylaminoimidazolesuccinocarboxamide synthase [Acidimicrobiia bacterium]|nr:phosphoribosylaminoimidazolesuccinocarboxamide synthase [Acidimicrobiia bacterium]
MLEATDLSALLGPVVRGKVRDVYTPGAGPAPATVAEGALDELVVLVATDRISAFDRVLGCVAGKGQLLTGISAWWSAQLADVLASHVVAVPDPAVTVTRRCTPLPVEVVVRGYLTGSTSTSVWTRYAAGERVAYGIELPDGLEKDDPLPAPILTPTTKAPEGAHDEPLSSAAVVERGLVAAPVWEAAVAAAHALFRRGSELAAAAGLTLVDTKYELGLDAAGRLTLIDEVHTPDSSRFWRAGTTEHLDKELLRLRYRAAGYRGEGEPPALWPDLADQLRAAYGEVHERLVGRSPELAPGPDEARIEENLRRWLSDRSSG